MNPDILKGKWKQISGDVKKQWGKLTDDDLMQIQGDQQKLVGKLQETYGYNKQEAEKQLETFKKEHNLHH